MLSELYVYVYLGQKKWVPAGLLEFEESGRYSSSRFRYGLKYLQHPHRVGTLLAGKKIWFLTFSFITTTITRGILGFFEPTREDGICRRSTMTLGTEGKKASIENALSRCERFRISKTEAQDIVHTMQIRMKDWREHFRNAGVSDLEINALGNSFKQSR